MSLRYLSLVVIAVVFSTGLFYGVEPKPLEQELSPVDVNAHNSEPLNIPVVLVGVGVWGVSAEAASAPAGLLALDVAAETVTEDLQSVHASESNVAVGVLELHGETATATPPLQDVDVTAPYVFVDSLSVDVDGAAYGVSAFALALPSADVDVDYADIVAATSQASISLTPTPQVNGFMLQHPDLMMARGSLNFTTPEGWRAPAFFSYYGRKWEALRLRQEEEGLTVEVTQAWVALYNEIVEYYEVLREREEEAEEAL